MDTFFCEGLPTLTHVALILGIFVHPLPPSCTGSLCNLLFLNLGIYGLVQATVGAGTVLIWDFCVACTRGGGGTSERARVGRGWRAKGLDGCLKKRCSTFWAMHRQACWSTPSTLLHKCTLCTCCGCYVHKTNRPLGTSNRVRGMHLGSVGCISGGALSAVQVSAVAYTRP